MALILRKDWPGLLRFVIRRFIVQECQKTAAAMTYTTLFALVPLMTVAYGILSALPSTDDASSGIQELLFSNLLPESSQMVSQYLADFAEQARKLTFVGVLFLIVTAVLMMKSIERAFNGIWSISEDRKGASSFLLYWSVLTLGPLLMGAGMAMTSFVVTHKLFLDAADTLGLTAILLQVMPLLTSSLAFMMLFHFVPKTYVPLKHAWLGGLFTAACFELAKWVFTQFVSESPSYQVVYGAFAAVPLFLLWIYISWNLLLLGATFVMALQRYQPNWQQVNREPFVVALQVIQSLSDNFREGKPLSQQALREMLSSLQNRDQKILLDVLQQAGILVRVKNDPPVKGWPKSYWQLGRNLESLTQWQLLTLLPWPVPVALNGLSAMPKEGFAVLSPSVITVLQNYLREGEAQLNASARHLFEPESGYQPR